MSCCKFCCGVDAHSFVNSAGTISLNSLSIHYESRSLAADTLDDSAVETIYHILPLPVIYSAALVPIMLSLFILSLALLDGPSPVFLDFRIL
jgi:hypothetical protein